MVKLQSQKTRKYNDKAYVKHWVTIPNKMIEKLNWECGEELNTRMHGNNLILEPVNSQVFNAIDLFSGCGGLSLGLSEAGFNIVLANELNKDAANTYEHNLNNIKGHNTEMLVEDITKLTTKQIKEVIGDTKIHLVAAGPPCQGFSLAGRRDINDPRNKLFKELLRVVKEIDPPVFLMENVKGILTMDGGKVIKQIEKKFKELEYHVKIRVLKASDFGVPQNRERVFIIGTKAFTDNIHPKPTNELVTVGDAISDLSFLNHGESSTIYKYEPKNEYQKKMREGSPVLRNHEAPKHTQTVVERFSKLKQGQTADSLPEEHKTKKRSLYRFDSKKPARTIVTIPDDYVHYSKNRVLTVRELARLQSFPDWFEFLGPRSTGGPRRKFEVPQYSQVGNAVPPMLAQVVGEGIIHHLNKHCKP